MSFLLKSAIAVLVVAVAGGFLVNQIPSWKQRVIEVINPAAKEARLLGELKANLDELENSFNSSGGSSSKESGDLIARSKNLVDEITATNQKNSGIIKQQVGKIIDAFLDKTPYPADHLQITNTASQSAAICPPAN